MPLTKITKNQLSKTEEKFIYYQKFHVAGSFTTSLFACIMKADISNLMKLSLGFPDEVDVVFKFKNQLGYWEDLEKRFELSHKQEEIQTKL